MERIGNSEQKADGIASDNIYVFTELRSLNSEINSVFDKGF